MDNHEEGFEGQRAFRGQKQSIDFQKGLADKLAELGAKNKAKKDKPEGKGDDIEIVEVEDNPEGEDAATTQ